MIKQNDPCWCGSGKKYKRCHHQPSMLLQPGTLSPTREVPAHIERPNYAETGDPGPEEEDAVKSPEVIERMRRAGRAAAEILQIAGDAVAVGVSTDDLDAIVHQATIDRGGYPSPLNYRGFPKSVCTSVNEVICHGVPDSTVLRDGDIINIDVTIYLDGVHGDTNATYLVGDVDPVSRKLVRVTRECTDLGIEAVKPGRPLSDIGKAIESHATKHGFEVVRAFIGHGIGTQFHTDLHVLHYYHPENSTIMEPGMTFTVEPMISLGTGQHYLWNDRWTAVTLDESRVAQFEHTLLVTDQGVERLTALTSEPATPPATPTPAPA